MKILFTLCGRAGSRGFENKNVQPFLAQPLSYYTLSALDLFQREYPEHDVDIALNTDSSRLQEQIRAYPMEIHHVERKESLAGDVIAKKAVIADTYLELSQKLDKEYDVVVDLDITSPLRTVDDINNIIRKFQETTADIVFSVTEARRNPYFNMVQQNPDTETFERVLASNFTTRQASPAIYDMNASLYAYSPAVLKKDNSLFDNVCEIILMADTGILDIDSLEDFELMQVIAEYFYKTKSKFGLIKEHLESVGF